jgi:hypothetical protein
MQGFLAAGADAWVGTTRALRRSGGVNRPEPRTLRTFNRLEETDALSVGGCQKFSWNSMTPGTPPAQSILSLARRPQKWSQRSAAASNAKAV